MSNIYHDHLEYLRSIKITSPAISIYIPLKWTELSAGKLFSALVKVADSLLLKEGHPKLNMHYSDWDLWKKQGTITLGIFHHAGVTTLIPLAIRMQPRVVVANSFHIKPILTAASEYIDALLLHFNERGASLYRVNAAGETLVDSFLPTVTKPKLDWPSRLDKNSLHEFLEFLNLDIKGSIKSTTKILGITGSGFSELRSESFWKKTGLPIAFLDESFKSDFPQNSFSILRLRLSQFVNEKHSQAVLKALKTNSSFKIGSSIQELGEDIVNKKINHLCVSLDDMRFGELDFTTGKVIVNKSQSNSKDDDLLDDLVEFAIDNGIKVSVVPKKYLPNGRSFVAS